MHNINMKHPIEEQREYWYDILHYAKACVAIDPRGDWIFLVYFLEGKYEIKRREPPTSPHIQSTIPTE